MPKAIDPICRMEVDTDNPAGGHSEYQGTTYYFCAPGCRVAFEKDPEQYLSGDGEQMAQQPHTPEPQKVSFISRIFGRK